MTSILVFIFVVTIMIPISSYGIYPVVIWALGKVFPFKPHSSDDRPSISILISAYNEQIFIREKIENTLNLNYPEDKVEIIIGSDGSTDNTCAIAREYTDRGIKLLDFPANRGKTAVQNDLVQSSRNDILIFTDAASLLSENTLIEIVKWFSDYRVGCVAGLMEFRNTAKNLTTQSQGLYWQYEMTLRRLESSIGSLIGVDGPLYAIKRDCYVFLEPHIISDFISPLLVLTQGKKVIIEEKALVFEDPTETSQNEFNTRRRITLRGLVGLFNFPHLLSPIKFPLLSFQVIFHKLIRWHIGILIGVNFICCVLLSKLPFFFAVSVLYLLFLSSAIGGWYFQRRGKTLSLLKIPYYFLLINMAAAAGIVDFLLKKKSISWTPVRK